MLYYALDGVFLHFWENFRFGALGICFFPKTLRKPREVKNGLIVLKFDTLMD